MRISRALVVALTLVIPACSIRPATGADGPPGAFGRASRLDTPRYNLLSSPPPPRLAAEFQNVLIIAPAVGARCRSSFATEANGIERRRRANARREVLLRIKTEAKSPKIICLHDGERWERVLPRVAMYQRPGRANGFQRADEIWASEAYSYPPIFHVAGGDRQSGQRWETWRRSVCDSAADLQLREVCAAFVALRDADLGASG